MTTYVSAPLKAITEVRDYDGTRVYLLRVKCPHCGRTHSHGGGTDRADIGKYLGHRASHCTSRDGYVITNPDGVT